MKQILTTIFALTVATAAQAIGTITVTVKNTTHQHITGFGAASCDGAMKPYGDDTAPASLLYNPKNKICLNIMRMEISPSFEGDNWGDYDWNGSLPSAKIVKKYGGIVFGTPWSPPGEYKTNGGANGGKVNDKDDNDPQNVRGKLREDCYDKFFPWLNSFLAWMKKNGVNVDAVSIQNEPDWWVNYSGCLYSPQELVNLVKNYAYMLDRETYNGVKLISGESLGFTQNYTDPLMNDATCREQIDIVAGHLYGHAPLDYMKKSAVLAAKYGKEVWMTEHSVTDYLKDRTPNWDEQIDFAQEVNECMMAGCTGYIYWYMRAHWAFVSTGETQYGSENRTKNRLLPRAYVMSHFSRNVTGSTRLEATANTTMGTNSDFQATAYVKGDSLIVMAINAVDKEYNLKLRLPVDVKSGTHILSTGNKKTELYQESEIEIAAPAKTITVNMPVKSLNTYILTIDRGEDAVAAPKLAGCKLPKSAFYDMQGRKMSTPHNGLFIEQRPDGTVRKVYTSRRQ